MQAFADRAAVSETLQTGCVEGGVFRGEEKGCVPTFIPNSPGLSNPHFPLHLYPLSLHSLATFYSRSRSGRWCKGETSGSYLTVASVHADCDGDSLVYLATPAGPACHTGAPSCWFAAAVPDAETGGIAQLKGRAAAPLPSLLALERTIADRATAPPPDDGAKPSWTARLLANEELLCSKVREEADELARALTDREGADRVASEAADLLYHAAVLLRAGGVSLEDVAAVLRGREGVSGVVEKASRPKK